MPPESVTFLFEVRLHNVDNFLPTLVGVSDFVQFLHLEKEVPWTIGVVKSKELFEVEMMRRARQHVFPDTAYNRQNNQSID